MLKYLLIFIAFISVSLEAALPNWYIKNDIPSNQYELIGYGKGKTKEEASQFAKSDIANSIQTTVKSSFISNTLSNNGSYSKNIESSISTSSNVNLSDLILMKTEYFDGVYYIALKYVNLPFTKKVKLTFDDVEGIKKETNSYLLNTPLLKELKDEFGFYPKVSIDKGNLIIGNKSFNISKTTLKKLFSSNINNNLKLKAPTELKHQELYFIKIKSKNNGYLTLIQIYENGETSILFDNKKVKNNSVFEYPNKNEYDGLEAYLNEKQIKAKDLTIAFICSEKKDFSYFDNISVNKEKYAKVYGKIFDMINGCDVSSKIIDIKR
ncbi:MAG: LPP20 family lipoprotein [Campylobacterota bacterium]|nr:LPP20 family lipoprotein [Campylobacterota bacterium]